MFVLPLLRFVCRNTFKIIFIGWKSELFELANNSIVLYNYPSHCILETSSPPQIVKSRTNWCKVLVSPYYSLNRCTLSSHQTRRRPTSADLKMCLSCRLIEALNAVLPVAGRAQKLYRMAELCKEHYVKWHGTRVQRILIFLSSLHYSSQSDSRPRARPSLVLQFRRVHIAFVHPQLIDSRIGGGGS